MANPPAGKQQTPGRFKAFWIGIIQFFAKLFKKSPSPVLPVAAIPSKHNNTALPVTIRPSLALIKHQRFSPQRKDWGKETNAHMHQAMSSVAQVSPLARAPSQSPKTPAGSPRNILPPPASPFPNISLSGLFASPPTLASPSLAYDIELGRLSPTTSVRTAILSPDFIPGSPPPLRNPSIGSPHSMASRSYSGSFHTPRTPNSVLMIQLDRSSMSPTAMSDGSLEVICLGNRRVFPGTPLKPANAVERLPSPWSPADATASFDVWMTAGGVLTNANGPVADNPVESPDDSAVLRSAIVSSLAASGSKFSDCTLISSASSSLEIIDLSVYVDLDGLEHESSGDSSNLQDNTDVPANNDAPVKVDITEVRDENKAPSATLITGPPRSRRDTVLSITKFQTPVKQASPLAVIAPLSKSESSNLLTSNSISSTAYELRLGLFGDGKSMTAIENIISLLDQASPESAVKRPEADHEDSTAIIIGAEAV
ncbi:hypothetical protein F5I97DRAFT_1498150 [Phlebopus sp. FC_14]|nr:hypothetical protein F5I97DRAFT_1498150 [Phlebopus sp. FC_14]